MSKVFLDSRRSNMENRNSPREISDQELRLAIALQVGHWNPGDALPTYCARRLLHQALSPISLDSWFLHEDSPLALPGFEFVPYDLAAVLCTPWIWDQGHVSRKYDILREFLIDVDAPKRIAVGIGSSFLLHHLGLGETVPGITEIRSCASDWQDFDLVICRDRLAQRLFTEILPPERIALLPCPSFYSAETFGVRHAPQAKHVLVYAALDANKYFGVRREDLASANAFQDDLVRSGVSVMTMMDRDRVAFEEQYGRPPDIDVRAPRDILAEVAQFETLTSPRVHACMPALSLGLETLIIPLDSRALTAIGLGARPVAVPLDLMTQFGAPMEKVSEESYAARIGAALA